MNHLFIVGAQRSGSTYLYHLLDSHPEVCMAKPVRPEPKFFLSDDLYRRGREFYEGTYFTSIPGQTRCRGEKSASYIESLTAARRIRDFYPDARILMILRDPVQRAWSNYRFSRQNRLESLEFEEALAAEPGRLASARFTTSVNPYAYIRRGHYMDYIEAYLGVFAARQLHILILEEIVGSLPATQSLYRFVGVDHSFVPPSLEKVINPGEGDCVLPRAAACYLAQRYEESVQRLELYLGRPLGVWQKSLEF